MALPILVLDERRLSPSLGYVFNPKWVSPDESIASILWRFARANGITGQEITSLALRKKIDPYEGAAFSYEEIHLPRLGKLLNLPLNTLRTGLGPRCNRTRMSANLRWCRSCMLQSYHSVVHQFECIQRCPIHRRVMETVCPTCGLASAYRLQARLLEASYRCGMCGARYTQFLRHQPLPAGHFVAIRHTRITRLAF
jgi:predicted RNA-binding Zn-ribbon protein involved in translation (DUF1610 family)